ncbi:uncharacterized protein PAC_18460 [Phialocephala subalpina]|uniref:Uncharacterized protein n=1 Tax=Phialocephala subalpina TaxID=576137 RepID=A0A1L7XU60_9HELO|nr:uncharacterized protein PAC_18460 [Phialocephala subalpina]
MSEIPCTRCKKTGHKSRVGGAHGTGGPECKKYKSDMFCDHCGHDNDHYSKKCQFKEKTEANANQYTKIKYDQAIASGKVKMATKAIEPSKSKTTPGLSLAEVEKKMKNANVKVVDASPLPEPTENEKEKTAWASANLDLAKYSPPGLASGPEILANSFTIGLADKNKLPDIRKYRIILGRLWDNKEEVETDDKKKKKNERPPKKETARGIIEDLLLNQFKPTGMWASDFFSHVVSVGKLYPGMADRPVAGECYEVDHYRPGKPVEGYQLVRGRVVYEGRLRVSDLFQYVSLTGSRPADYLPDRDLHILNLVVWKDINMPGIQRGRVGKKFFPVNQHPAHQDVIYANKQDRYSQLYLSKTGFFTSARPDTEVIIPHAFTTASWRQLEQHMMLCS